MIIILPSFQGNHNDICLLIIAKIAFGILHVQTATISHYIYIYIYIYVYTYHKTDLHEFSLPVPRSCYVTIYFIFIYIFLVW